MIYQGRCVSEGIAIGRIAIYKKSESIIKRKKTDDPEAEVKRFNKARDVAAEQLDDLYEKAYDEAGKDAAGVFSSHRMMLFDPTFTDPIIDMIWRERVSAEYAVSTAANALAAMFAVMDDEYMQLRATDIHDISGRVVNILIHSDISDMGEGEPVIIAADDLLPSETIRFDRSKVLAFVTHHGSHDSHASILARSMHIPALVGVDISPECDGHTCIVDGPGSRLIIDPTADEIAEYQKKIDAEKRKRKKLSKLKGQSNVTADGKEIGLCANIGSVADADEAVKNDAGGIGLFRTEFLYLNNDTYPTEDEQFESYRAVVEKMSPNRVIIRTLDIGADKQVKYMDLPEEVNPALGYRGIRISLDRPDIFKTQLRAIYRASAYGKVAIMFPMVSSVFEVERIKEIINEVTSSLDADGVDYDNVEVGVMIETPAAVMISDDLAAQVDFLSIGTNDLMQYMLAADRQNPALDHIRDTQHPSLMRAIKMTCENAHGNGAWVGVCGELAADTKLIDKLLKMGVDELSVAPSQILAVREEIRKTDLSKK